MKITKKLAKEIFEGNFENLPLEELKNPRVTTNYFNSVSDFEKEYSKPEYLSSKDFEGVTYLKIIHTKGSEYHGKKSSKYHVMTDVLHVWNHHGKWYVTIARENSGYYDKNVEIQMNDGTYMKAIARILKSQKEILRPNTKIIAI